MGRDTASNNRRRAQSTYARSTQSLRCKYLSKLVDANGWQLARTKDTDEDPLLWAWLLSYVLYILRR